MDPSLKKKGLWALIALSLFSLFYWLFDLAMPGAALPFAGGTTIVIMGGLLTGRYAAKLGYKVPAARFPTLLATLAAAALLSLLGIGLFISKMMEQTQFHYFLFTIVCLFLVSGLVAAIISLVRHRIKSRMQSAQAALAQSRTELQLLQSQLSPHFLFNTLNNLYGLSLSDHQKVPALLLKLAELLRYSVYEAKEVFVPLADEVNYLKNYIEFEKIRLGDRLTLKADFPEEHAPSLKIAPMLLIVFVENAFKHSRNNEAPRIRVEMSLKATPGGLLFAITNSCAPPGSRPAPPTYSGFGLESVKKRLDLLYRHRHELKIHREERSFSITLVLTHHENQVFDH